ncbi:hypothetical protein MASR1M65_05260 [Saprospiraceae bacterium]
MYSAIQTKHTLIGYRGGRFVSTHIAQFESTYFDKVYYSHLVGMRKPDMAIFTHIMSNTGIDPAETLFVDDNFDNITAGKLAGLHVHHHNPEFEIFDILPDILKVANT